MNSVFFDTVGLLALWNVDDQWHSQAETAFRQLQSAPFRLITTPYVLIEYGNAAARTAFRSDVFELRNELVAHGNLLSPTVHEEQTAWSAYTRGEAGSAGIVDHFSFILMRREGIAEAFTNDAHFKTAGFVTLF